MASRVALLMMVYEARGQMFTMEQPRRSWLELHPRIQKYMQKSKLWRASFEMNQFGHRAAKPTWLYSNKEAVLHILDYALPEPPGKTLKLMKTYKDKDGNAKCCGNENLKGSQDLLGPPRSLKITLSPAVEIPRHQQKHSPL
eukprot:12415911-Karenia_brevis.AAC.1